MYTQTQARGRGRGRACSDSGVWQVHILKRQLAINPTVSTDYTPHFCEFLAVTTPCVSLSLAISIHGGRGAWGSWGWGSGGWEASILRCVMYMKYGIWICSAWNMEYEIMLKCLLALDCPVTPNFSVYMYICIYTSIHLYNYISVSINTTDH